MRLNRLNLTRFGHFTDFSLDFGPREDGKADLHIIFGPNEAGKTTAFEGYLDLLFGIPTRSKYNFLHDYENMRVGAVLEIDDKPTELIRIKRNKNDLITPTGDLANSGVLMHPLDGLDRDQYQAMFSLDDETIEKGGEDILASQGNLGELLFSAAAGLSDLGNVLVSAREDINQFHKPRARKTDLAEAKRQLQELHHEIREFDVPASTFRRLKEERDQAQGLLDEAMQNRDALLDQKARLSAMIDCIPLMQSFRKTKEQLDAFANYPSPPNTWRDEAQNLKLAQVEAETELRQSKQQLTDNQTARDKLDIDARIIDVAEELTVLIDVPKSRAQTAAEDLPKRETELEGLVEEIASLANDLKLEAPQSGVLSEALLELLEGLAKEYGETKLARSTAENEHADAVETLEALNEGTEGQRMDASPHAGLEDLLTKLEPEQRISDVDKASEAMADAEVALKKAFARLSPWSGDRSDLPNLTLSAEQAKRIAERWIEVTETCTTAQTGKTDARLALDRRTARLEALSHGDAAAIHEDAQQARAERNTLWAEHLAELSPDTANAFEQAMSQDDSLQEARLAVAEKLARLKEQQVEVAEAQIELETWSERFTAAENALSSEQKAVTATLVGLGLPEDYDPRDLPAWQTHLSAARDGLTDLDTKTTLQADAEMAVADAASEIRKALGVADDAIGLRDLTKRARATLAQNAKAQAALEAHQKALSTAERGVQRREQELQRLSEALSEIQERWETVTKTLPIPLKDLDQFGWKISTLRQLAGKAKEQGKLERRTKAMRDDQERFEGEISKLANAIDQPTGAAPLVIAEQLKTRLDEASTAHQRFEELTEKIDTSQNAVRTAESAIAAITARLEEMAEPFAGVRDIENLDDLLAALTKSAEINELRVKADEIHDQILARLGVSNLQEAEMVLSDQDVLSLEAQRDGVQKDLKDAEANYADKIGDLRAANDALKRIGGDNAPAQLEEKRQTLLLDLEDRAKVALRLRLGVFTAEQAISNYRDAHRSKMLADTEKAFSTLTGGEYHDLRTQSDGHKEVLLALRQHDGRSITVSEMSKGTRFQLYLALRLAGYRQYTASGTTLPFVADDIMETFDNNRTSAALGLLREIAYQGQALYFTHHEHVVELARDVCGDDITVHEL